MKLGSLKPYAAYRDSGVTWVQKIPAHWKHNRAKAFLQALDVRSKSGKEELLTVSSAHGILPRKHASVTMFEAKSYVGYKLCWPGDLVINSLWAWAGGLGISKHHGIISSAYGVYRVRSGAEMLPQYLHYLLRSAAFQTELQVRSKGIWISRLQMTDESFLNAPLIAPPLKEQEAIVRFLDWANNRLDRAIRAKKKVIALLNEQKQAIIHRAVTRGIDPNVKMKDSGIPWLGEIPEHWTAVLFGRLIRRIEQGWSPVAAEGDLGEDQFAVTTLSAIRRGQFNPIAIKPIQKNAVVPTELILSDGDFLLSRSNTRDRVGDVCIVQNVRPRTILCDLIYRLRLQKKVCSPDYLAYLLLSPLGRMQIEKDARGSSGTMPKISQSHIKQWRILLPPIDEQVSISNSIFVALRPIEEAITKLQHEIHTLNEYRIGLISMSVVGNNDVSGVNIEAEIDRETEDSGVESEDLDEPITLEVTA